MIIGSFGDKYAEGIKCSPKEKRPLGAGAGLIKHDFLPGVRGDAEKLQDMIRKDKDKELVYSLMEIPGVQETKQFYINYITKFFKECSKNGALIYYTGHGEFGTGNWCFKDGTISLQEILALYFDYFRGKLLYIFTDCCYSDCCIITCFHGKLLYIFTDCCYSGHWVVELAKYLDDLGIGACGHQARELGLLFKIVASCEQDQKAADVSSTDSQYKKQELRTEKWCFDKEKCK
ncbi:uncharacterized protein [Dysidea avara]|uniref:uncharacterized protein n=1 Tax=Dysidea avara TaxID=196820 RepID=UPI0033241B24